MVGNASRIRVSSTTVPSYNGQLKSTRTSTRFVGYVDVLDGLLGIHASPLFCEMYPPTWPCLFAFRCTLGT